MKTEFTSKTENFAKHLANAWKLGARAGNTQTEVLVAVLEKMGIQTGINLYKMMDLAEEIVAPFYQVPKKLIVTV